MADDDRISLIGIGVMATHGVLPEERSAPQPFEIDVILLGDLSGAAASDDLGQTVDYAQLLAVVRREAQARSFALMEALAAAIGQAIIDELEVEEVEVRVRKPRAPLPGPLRHVEVALTVRRGARRPRDGRD